MRTILSTRSWLACLFSAGLAASAACDLAFVDLSEQHTERWSKTYELQPGSRVELRNVNGRIEVHPAAGRQVEVEAEKVARAASVEMAKAAIGRVRIDEEETAAGGRITTRIDRSGGLFDRTGNVNVRYTVRVPADVEIEFATTNGGIELTGVQARAKLTTTNGGIKARDVAGPLEAQTTNGGLEVTLARIADGGVWLACTNGGIELTLPSDGRASIDASVTNGGIDTGSLRLDTLESSRRRLSANLNGGGPRIDLRCTNGGLRLNER